MNIDVKEHACCNCGMIFWLPVKMDTELQRNKKSFYCPQGHSMNYSGDTEAKKNLKLFEESQNEVSRLRQELSICLKNKSKRGRKKKVEEHIK